MRKLVAIAAVVLMTLATLPGCITNLVGGCPVTDDGDDCVAGSTRCDDDHTLSTCNSGGSCDAYWIERDCPSGTVCRENADRRAECAAP